MPFYALQCDSNERNSGILGRNTGSPTLCVCCVSDFFFLQSVPLSTLTDVQCCTGTSNIWLIFCETCFQCVPCTHAWAHADTTTSRLSFAHLFRLHVHMHRAKAGKAGKNMLFVYVLFARTSCSEDRECEQTSQTCLPIVP